MTTSVRLRHVAQVNPATPEFERLSDEAPVTFLPLEAVWPGVAFDTSRVRPKAEVAAGYTRFRAGDILIPKITPTFQANRSVIAAGLLGDVGAGTTELHVVRPGSSVDPRYLLYSLSTRPFLREGEASMIGVAGQKRVPDDFLRDLCLWLPPHPLQRAIADYLDAETAQIDALVQLRRAQAVLNTARRVEASRAAFCGDGAPAGGLPWAPEVPGEWPVIHLRLLAMCLDGRRIPVNREERATMQGDIPYWGANGIVDHVERALFHEPLVLLGEDGAPFFDREKAKAFFVDSPVWVNNHMHVLRAIRIRPRFLAHYLNLVDYADFVGGSTRDKLTQDDMGSIPVPVPPPMEQERIEREVSVVNRWADDFQAATERQIALLLERRQALITAVVTGQLEIPGVTA